METNSSGGTMDRCSRNISHPQDPKGKDFDREGHHQPPRSKGHMDITTHLGKGTSTELSRNLNGEDNTLHPKENQTDGSTTHGM